MAIFDLIGREGFVAAPAPPGVTPNFDHPESNGGMYMAGTLTTLCVAFIFVVLRLTTKVSMAGRKLGWDDVLIVFALAFSIARATCFIVDIEHYGIAHHVWDLRLPINRNTWLLHRIGDIMWPPGILCAKVSILMYYLSIFRPSKAFRWTVYGTLVFTICYLIASTLVQVFWCNPVAAAFGIKTPGKKAVCLDGYVTDLAIGALNLLTDIIILVLPMPMLYRLQLSRGRKLGLAAIFAIGGFAVGATLARNVEIAVKLKDSDADQTWDVMYEAVWISIELNVTIICSCLLVCPQLFRYVLTNTKVGQSLRSLFGSTRTTQDSASRGSLSGFNRRSPRSKHYLPQDSEIELDRKSARSFSDEIPDGAIRETRTVDQTIV
ncbi:uncharacterized protein EAF02_006302 [Botrytis sinoallii]|uniref:uncharacterized protein n=1 Tax=Botrytis sinoallii TaxID=1463999 RepID=UPI0018FF8905|nr:uncharacterized protein EAF02_006302 [Botrytis sinoallii]KAF7881614.1 hypothetical protein EAF02_006302 [Botrytis sinoallii]